MNLNLAIQERFNSTICDFYENESKEILLTREQVGEALEYTDPKNSISKIHSRHKDRLDKFSVVDKLSTPYGYQEKFLYNTKGIMEICRWSRQPKADKFMDFVWDIADKLIKGQFNTTHSNTIDSETFNKTMELINIQQQQIKDQQEQINKLLSRNTAPLKSAWKTMTFRKLNTIADYYDTDLKTVMAGLWQELRNRYNISIIDYKQECVEISKIKALLPAIIAGFMSIKNVGKLNSQNMPAYAQLQLVA